MRERSPRSCSVTPIGLRLPAALEIFKSLTICTSTCFDFALDFNLFTNRAVANVLSATGPSLRNDIHPNYYLHGLQERITEDDLRMRDFNVIIFFFLPHTEFIYSDLNHFFVTFINSNFVQNKRKFKLFAKAYL